MQRSSFCKVVVKGRGWIKSRSDDKAIFLHIVSTEGTANLFEDKPQGHAIMRLDPVFVDTRLRSPLLLTYKYGSMLYTQKLRVPDLKVKNSRKGGLICTTDKLTAQYIQEVAEFLTKLQKFIEEFTCNVNFVEKNLENTPDLQNEVFFRKFIIFPASGTRLVLIKKQQDQLIRAEAGVNFANLTFFGKMGDHIKTITSFNSFLLEFLDINAERNPEFASQVHAALGYGYRSRVNQPLGGSLPSPRNQHAKGPEAFDILSLKGKDKLKLLESLSRVLAVPDVPEGVIIEPPIVSSRCSLLLNGKKKDGDEIMQVLEEVSSAVKVLQLSNEKMEWIEAGLFNVLLQYREYPGFNNTLKRRQGNELQMYDKRDLTVIKILRHLVSNNPEACLELCDLMFDMMFQRPAIPIPLEDCFPFLQIIYALITQSDVKTFVSVLIRELGIAKLLSIYNVARVEMEEALQEEEELEANMSEEVEKGGSTGPFPVLIQQQQQEILAAQDDMGFLFESHSPRTTENFKRPRTQNLIDGFRRSRIKKTEGPTGESEAEEE